MSQRGSDEVTPEPEETASAGPAQGSGRQFERGTRSEPDETETETGAPGPGTGASASGKRFARGTDSDGDGRAYDEPAGP